MEIETPTMQEFDASALPADAFAGDPDAPDQGADMDAFFSQEVDADKAAQIERSSLLPNGTYQTDPESLGELTPGYREVEEKDDAGEVIGKRPVITVAGRGRARVRLKNPKTGQVEQTEVVGSFRAELSPAERFKRDYETGEELSSYDSKSKLWAQAVRAYKETFGEAPKTIGQVVEYLTKYPVRFRLIQIGVPTKSNPHPEGEPRNFVMAISAVRKK